MDDNAEYLSDYLSTIRVRRNPDNTRYIGWKLFPSFKKKSSKSSKPKPKTVSTTVIKTKDDGSVKVKERKKKKGFFSYAKKKANSALKALTRRSDKHRQTLRPEQLDQSKQEKADIHHLKQSGLYDYKKHHQVEGAHSPHSPTETHGSSSPESHIATHTTPGTHSSAESHTTTPTHHGHAGSGHDSSESHTTHHTPTEGHTSTTHHNPQEHESHPHSTSEHHSQESPHSESGGGSGGGGGSSGGGGGGGSSGGGGGSSGGGESEALASSSGQPNMNQGQSQQAGVSDEMNRLASMKGENYTPDDLKSFYRNYYQYLKASNQHLTFLGALSSLRDNPVKYKSRRAYLNAWIDHITAQWRANPSMIKSFIGKPMIETKSMEEKIEHRLDKWVVTFQDEEKARKWIRQGNLHILEEEIIPYLGKKEWKEFIELAKRKLDSGKKLPSVKKLFEEFKIIKNKPFDKKRYAVVMVRETERGLYDFHDESEINGQFLFNASERKRSDVTFVKRINDIYKRIFSMMGHFPIRYLQIAMIYIENDLLRPEEFEEILTAMKTKVSSINKVYANELKQEKYNLHQKKLASGIPEHEVSLRELVVDIMEYLNEMRTYIAFKLSPGKFPASKKFRSGWKLYGDDEQTYEKKMKEYIGYIEQRMDKNSYMHRQPMLKEEIIGYIKNIYNANRRLSSYLPNIQVINMNGTALQSFITVQMMKLSYALAFIKYFTEEEVDQAVEMLITEDDAKISHEKPSSIGSSLNPGYQENNANLYRNSLVARVPVMERNANIGFCMKDMFHSFCSWNPCKKKKCQTGCFQCCDERIPGYYMTKGKEPSFPENHWSNSETLKMFNKAHLSAGAVLGFSNGCDCKYTFFDRCWNGSDGLRGVTQKMCSSNRWDGVFVEFQVEEGKLFAVSNCINLKMRAELEFKPPTTTDSCDSGMNEQKINESMATHECRIQSIIGGEMVKKAFTEHTIGCKCHKKDNLFMGMHMGQYDRSDYKYSSLYHMDKNEEIKHIKEKETEIRQNLNTIRSLIGNNENDKSSPIKSYLDDKFQHPFHDIVDESHNIIAIRLDHPELMDHLNDQMEIRTRKIETNVNGGNAQTGGTTAITNPSPIGAWWDYLYYKGEEAVSKAPQKSKEVLDKTKATVKRWTQKSSLETYAEILLRQPEFKNALAFLKATPYNDWIEFNKKLTAYNEDLKYTSLINALTSYAKKRSYPLNTLYDMVYVASRMPSGLVQNIHLDLDAMNDMGKTKDYKLQYTIRLNKLNVAYVPALSGILVLYTDKTQEMLKKIGYGIQMRVSDLLKTKGDDYIYDRQNDRVMVRIGDWLASVKNEKFLVTDCFYADHALKNIKDNIECIMKKGVEHTKKKGNVMVNDKTVPLPKKEEEKDTSQKPIGNWLCPKPACLPKPNPCRLCDFKINRDSCFTNKCDNMIMKIHPCEKPVTVVPVKRLPSKVTYKGRITLKEHLSGAQCFTMKDICGSNSQLLVRFSRKKVESPSVFSKLNQCQPNVECHEAFYLSSLVFYFFDYC